MDSCAFAGGPFVEQFEVEFAKFCQSKYCVGVGSGTEALWLSLLALGIGPGDEVITAPNTFIATAEAISFCGAKPVFVDIDEQTYTLNPNLIEFAITPRTRAIIPVHLFGQMADMDPILVIAKEHGLFVVEDAAQAQGATYKNKMAGSIGDMGCFSFYPGKNLGAYGEAGAVVTSSLEMAEKIRKLRDHGQSKKYIHDLVGWNSRMDGFQGAVLSVKLKYLSGWNEKRKENARLYDELLSAADSIICPKVADCRGHVYHIYAVRIANRDKLIDFLAERDVQCSIHYPVPLHLTGAFGSLPHYRSEYTIVEQCAKELVSLPMFPELNSEQIVFVVDEIKEFARV
jgi:dTDP-4-amino-4,6-dideoxygalactose transaminase